MLKPNQQTPKIIYSIVIIGFYIITLILQSNPFLAFVLVLNILYFSRIILYKKLFSIITLEPQQANSISQIPIVQTESDILPENIKNVLIKKTIKQNFSPYFLKDDPKEDLLIRAFQKAEVMIDQKIKELQSKKPVKKSDVINTQDEIKLEIVKKLPEVPVTEEKWIFWSPLTLHDKIMTLEIYCEKCEHPIKVKETNYEIEKQSDHYKITSVHNRNSENHTNIAKVTLDTFEILSKPVLQIDQAKEVEA